jgi:hypothetical protein
VKKTHSAGASSGDHTHTLPWRLMAFLADAHRRGVLRQVGSVYQFRHIELQRRLTNNVPTGKSRLKYFITRSRRRLPLNIDEMERSENLRTFGQPS